MEKIKIEVTFSCIQKDSKTLVLYMEIDADKDMIKECLKNRQEGDPEEGPWGELASVEETLRDYITTDVRVDLQCEEYAKHFNEE